MRRILIIFFFLIAFWIKAQDNLQKIVPADSIIEFGKKLMGTRYNYGSSNPKTGFDCSGFVHYVFNHFKIEVPRASMDYQKMGREIPLDSAIKGDIMVFTGTKPANRAPGHVGIVVSMPGEDLKFIHSSSSKKESGVKITNYTKTSGYQIRFIKVVRLSRVKN